MSNPSSISRLRGAACLAALVSGATIAAEPQFTALATASVAKAQRGEKFAQAQALPAPVSNEMRATLGADGKVRLECVSVRRSAFDASPRGAMPPTEAK